MKERVRQNERKMLWWTRKLDDLKCQVRKSRKRWQKARRKRKQDADVILSRTIRLFVKLPTLTGTKFQANYLRRICDNITTELEDQQDLRGTRDLPPRYISFYI